MAKMTEAIIKENGLTQIVIIHTLNWRDGFIFVVNAENMLYRIDL